MALNEDGDGKKQSHLYCSRQDGLLPSAHPVSRFYCHYRLLSEQLINIYPCHQLVMRWITSKPSYTYLKSFLFYTLCSKRPVLGYLARDTDTTDGAFARCDFGRDISRLRRAESSSSFSHKMDFILSRRAEGYKTANGVRRLPKYGRKLPQVMGLTSKHSLNGRDLLGIHVAGKIT